ncbi:hypothetical protein EHI8A_161710, partial [Entamoeba histolytica HM-1:IMSS-B]
NISLFFYSSFYFINCICIVVYFSFCSILFYSPFLYSLYLFYFYFILV